MFAFGYIVTKQAPEYIIYFISIISLVVIAINYARVEVVYIRHV